MLFFVYLLYFNKAVKKKQANQTGVLTNQNTCTGTQANQKEGLHYSIPPQGFRL